MRIRSDALVAGFPAKEIRELLRKSGEFLCVDYTMKVLGIDASKAARLLDDLEAEGYIERDSHTPNRQNERYWKRTIKGGALCNALFSTPVSRRTAETKLQEFMDRVHEVNANSRFLYRVDKVVLFGSFLTDAPQVGDLDLAVQLSPKEADCEKHAQLVQARAADAAGRGKQFPSFIDRLTFAYSEVRSFLKARSRIIQLSDCTDGILKTTETRVIYPLPQPHL
jgi:DNA-binding MarR family transcriptional regulator